MIPQNNILAANNAGNAVRVQNISVNHTFTVSSSMLINSVFGLNRQRGGSLSSAPFSYPDAGVKIASAASSALKAPPEIVMSVTGAFSISTNHLGDFDRGDFTIRENVTKIHGAHEFHFGGEAVRLSNHITNTFRMDGNFTFNGQLSGDGLADFMLGRASTFVQGGGEFKNLKGTKWGFYAQDNWRVNRDLTLNLGLRWDPYFPYYDREGRVICFQPGAKSKRYPNAPAGMLYGGDNHDPGCPVGGSEKNVANFAPRIGFAYRLTQDGRTSLRGGFGYFYTPIQASSFNPFTNIAPFAPGFSFDGVAFEDPFGSAGVTNPFPAGRADFRSRFRAAATTHSPASTAIGRIFWAAKPIWDRTGRMARWSPSISIPPGSCSMPWVRSGIPGRTLSVDRSISTRTSDC